MNLTYITRVNIPSQAAQSVQIKSMCDCFYNELNDHFELISSLNNENLNIKTPYKWIKVKLPQNRYLRYAFFSLNVILLVKKNPPDFIYTRDIVVALFMVLFKYKAIYEVHKEPKGLIATFIFKFLIRKSRFNLIAISESLKHYYMDNFKLKKNKIYTYHDAVFVDKYDRIRNIDKKALRKEINLPIDKTIIMHTGNLYKGRGAELFGIILNNFTEMVFVQVGGTEQDIIHWKDQYKHYSNIIFIPHQDNESLIKYQMSADILFYMITEQTDTYWCCSPMKIFEYMATGVPILANNIGSINEIITNKNAIIYDLKEPKTIIDGVNQFFNNRSEAIRKAKVSLSLIRNQYTWGKRTRCILNFIKSLDN